MKFDFLKLKQVASLPFIKSKFFATFFTTLITATINIARDSKGIIYVISQNIYHAIAGKKLPDNPALRALINTGSVFIRSLDVAVSVIVIFTILYFLIGIIQNRTYSKRFSKRREYLKELLWENIIPNIVEMNNKEIELINARVTSVGLDEKKWIITISALAELHIELSYLVLRKGIIEEVANNSELNEHYLMYLESINLPLAGVIFQHEEETIKSLCSALKDKCESSEAYMVLYNKYNQIYKNYHKITNLITSNKSHPPKIYAKLYKKTV